MNFHGSRGWRAVGGLIAMLAMSCTPEPGKSAGSAAPPLTMLNIMLPPSHALPSEIMPTLTGVHFVVDPLPNTCSGPPVVDFVSRLSSATYSIAVRPDCDYSIGIELGTLDATGKFLAPVQMTNLKTRYQGLVVNRGALAGRSSLDVYTQLELTASGQAARHARSKEAPGWVLGKLPPAPSWLPAVLQVPWPFPPLFAPAPTPTAPGSPSSPTPQPQATIPTTPVVPGPGPMVPGPVVFPPAGAEPGANVQFISIPATHQVNNPAFGATLNDVMSHEAPGDTNNFDDPDTQAHETTHGINSYIRNTFNKTGRAANGFYVLGGKGVIVAEPSILKSQIAQMIPQSLRGGRYPTYLVEQTAWDKQPLYVWDEWVSYINGATVSVERFATGLDHPAAGTHTDVVFAVLEFEVYALVTAMTARINDPNYFASAHGLQMREFLAWNTKRGMDLYRRGSVQPPYVWTDGERYYQSLKTSPDAESLRQFARQTFGDAWTKSVLGF